MCTVNGILLEGMVAFVDFLFVLPAQLQNDKVVSFSFQLWLALGQRGRLAICEGFKSGSVYVRAHVGLAVTSSMLC